MNNHLKLVIYIAMIAGIFLFVQDRFDMFEVSFKDGQSVQSENAVKEDSDGEIPDEQGEINDQQYIEIQIPNGLNVRVDVEVADNDFERSRGLSGRRYLGDYEGMFFVFDSEVNTPFWMKDMLIPLDILFIDSQNLIVDIWQDQQPCEENFCPSIYSHEDFKYVLEVNSGFCEENHVEEGYSVVQYLE
jgi:hypothetical protein